MTIFNSYVSLPEGICTDLHFGTTPRRNHQEARVAGTRKCPIHTYQNLVAISRSAGDCWGNIIIVTVASSLSAGR